MSGGGMIRAFSSPSVNAEASGPTPRRKLHLVSREALRHPSGSAEGDIKVPEEYSQATLHLRWQTGSPDVAMNAFHGRGAGLGGRHPRAGQ